MVRRIGFGDGERRTSSPGAPKQTTAEPSSPAEAAAAPPAARRAARPTTDRPAAARQRGSTPGWLLTVLQFAFSVAILVTAAQAAIGGVGGVDALLALPDNLAAGEVDVAETLLAVAGPIIGAVLALWVLDLVVTALRPRADARTATYEAVTPRQAQRAADALHEARPDLVEAAEEAQAGPAGCGRLLIGVFLLVWLAGWSVGILLAGGQLMLSLEEGAYTPDVAFLAVWVGVASLAWAFVVRVLIRLAMGQDITPQKNRSRRR